jgi:two-component system, chemotaxis family, protein-glutamate methylesterase/glutaminase
MMAKENSGNSDRARAGHPVPPPYYRLIVIGASLGGLRALEVILSGLPRDFSLPVAIVQHRSSESDSGLGRLLQRFCPLPVTEVEDKDAIEPGCVYLAPADYHLLVDEDGFALSNDEPVNYSRPSIDALFDSAADAWGSQVIGVLLTGNSSDGAAGLAHIQRAGGLALVQDPATAEAAAMPTAAVAAGAVDLIMPLEDIGPYLVSICRAGPGKRRAGK